MTQRFFNQTQLSTLQVIRRKLLRESLMIREVTKYQLIDQWFPNWGPYSSFRGTVVRTRYLEAGAEAMTFFFGLQLQRSLILVLKGREISK